MFEERFIRLNDMWKDIKGFEGKYQYNDNGEVRSIDRLVKKAEGAYHRQKGRVLKPFKRTIKTFRYKLYSENKMTIVEIKKK